MDFVKDLNLNRRQLSTTARAMVAARMKPMYAAEAKERQRATQLAGKDEDGNYVTSVGPVWDAPKENKGRANEIVAEKLGVSRNSVSRASNVLKNGTEELVKAVDQGKLTVNHADKIARLPKAVQDEAVR